MEFRFQVNLGGIIDLLSNHTYSSPEVYVRELLQNGVDAIVARSHVEPNFQGEMNIELSLADNQSDHFLVFRDNGIGLAEAEIHLFLATIGESSKRDELLVGRTDFIGHFGVGLLSCFMVSDEIVVLTRSAAKESETIEWRGQSDGTYSLTKLDREIAAGTEVRLRCKKGSEDYFLPETVKRLARRYGGLLPFPIKFSDPTGSVRLNEEEPPWRTRFFDAELERYDYLQYGKDTFDLDFFDYVPLRSTVGDVQGVAFVLPFSPSLSSRKTHRVYLKNMLLSEQAEGLLPDWAFFVKCVVNANDLRPTASREAFYEDDKLAATRAALGEQLRRYLINLAADNPQRLKKLLQLHFLSIKALAVDDQEFFRIVVNWLPFETNMGTMTLTEYLKEHEAVRYMVDLDQFRQTARIAAAQSLCVINASYVYDDRLMGQLSEVFPDALVMLIDSTSLTHSFEQLMLSEQQDVAEFIRVANDVLAPFNCSVEVRRFSPDELPALHIANSDALFQRSVESTKQVTDSFWSSLLDETRAGWEDDELSELCLNYRNPVVHKITRMRDADLLRLSIQMLYVQAILLSHRPLNAKEMALLNQGLLRFIEWGADAVEGWIQ